jgi:putative ABC transport system ATP-binding protein
MSDDTTDSIRRWGADVKIEKLEMEYRVGDKVVRGLDGLDLTVPAGQLLMARGPSGSGKSTLLHLIAGLQKATGGSVQIGDFEIQAVSTVEADLFRRRNIGLIFQFFNLIPSLSVEMNIALPLLMDGHRLRKVRPQVDALLELLKIDARRDHAPGQLSGGEMQRVAIARALIVKPRLILADEPTGNLDSRTSHDVFGLLRDRAEQHGVTAIVMTHDVDVSSYADRLIEISDGRITSDTGVLPGDSDAR